MNEHNVGWYEPLKRSEQPVNGSSAKKKKHRAWFIAGGILLLVLLIVGTSLIFAEKNGGLDLPFGYDYDIFTGEAEELPDDWQDFFDGYYTTTEGEFKPVNIPKETVPVNFTVKTDTESGEELTLQELYKSCSRSIVAISGYADDVEGYAWGTGVILSEDGIILTNTHVIESCDSAIVTLYDDTTYEAKLVGADSISDIAVLKVDAHGLIPARFGDSSGLTVGDRVAAIGNPLGEEFRLTMTDGIVSAIERGISYNGHTMTLLQTNTALNGGNSGGALFNMFGQVVGITNMKMASTYSNSIEGIGFAIPSNYAADYVNSLIKNGVVAGRTSIGITVGAIPRNAAEHYQLPEGLYISSVSPGSDAEAKGVRPGDILTAVNTIPVTETQQVLDIKNTLSVGDIIVLTVWRDGVTKDYEVVLADTNDIYK